MSNIQILIPSLNPDSKLLGVIDGLLEQSDYDIVLVNDGSDMSRYHIFEEFASNSRCTVLHHAVNLGKGRALKTGFNHILNTCPDTIGVVTVDGDGQHATKDIIACAQALCARPDSLVLGSRDFDKSNVPAKSSYGNKITRSVMKILCGIDIPDTQTGLRGINRDFMKILMNVSGERFEFETNMLLSAKEHGIPFNIVTIDTIYLDDNATSHFNPIKDSIRIYSLFAKFLFASLSSSVVDILFFTVFVSLFREAFPLYYIFISTAMARVISAIYNFNVNKRSVFKNKAKDSTIAIKYFSLCVVQMLASSAGVKAVFDLLHINESLIKIVVDTILFFISFQIQREWVFKKRKGNSANK